MGEQPKIEDGSIPEMDNEGGSPTSVISGITSTSTVSDVERLLRTESAQQSTDQGAGSSSVAEKGSGQCENRQQNKTEQEREAAEGPRAEHSVNPENPEQAIDRTADLAVTGSNAGVGNLDNITAAVQQIRISDEEVPDHLRLPQIDLLVVHSERDSKGAQTFLKQVTSKKDNVEGELFAAFLVEDQQGTMLISNQRPDAISKNIQRVTYVFLYITKAFCVDAEARSAYFESLQGTLVDKRRNNCLIPVWVDPKDELELYIRHSLEDCSGLLSLFVFNGVRNDECEFPKVRQLLRDKRTQHKKEVRVRDQNRLQEEWKQQRQLEVLEMMKGHDKYPS